MSSPLVFELVPVNSGDKSTEHIKIPAGETVIGRGELLGVADKRVSRNHGVLNVTSDGKFIITATHSNPCFYQKEGVGPATMLQKDKSTELNNGDVFSLLPNSFSYKIIKVAETKNESENQQSKDKAENKSNGATEDKPITDDQENAKEERKSSNDSGDENDENKDVGTKQGDTKASTNGKTAKVGDKEMALPLAKTRKLPDWMLEDTGDEEEVEEKEKPVQPKKGRGRGKGRGESASTPGKGRGRGRPAAVPVRRKKAEISEDEDLSEEEEEFKPRRKTPRKRGKKQDSDDEYTSPSRPRRQASQNRPSYSDDLVLSDAEFSDEPEVPKKKKWQLADSDSDFDFVVEEDSGSDWESGSKGTPKKAKGGAGGRRGRPSGRGKSKRKHGSDSEEDFSDDDDEYIPRPTKRRGGKPTPTKKKRQICEYGKDCYRKNDAHFKDFIHPGDSDYPSEGDDDDGASSDASVPECEYGEDCYRKNPQHFKDYKHTKKTDRPKREAAAKAKPIVDDADEAGDLDMSVEEVD